MKIAILILAAGSSSRMGSLKQLLPIKHTTLLGLTIEHAIKSKANKTYCVLGDHANQIKKTIKHYPIETILNSEFDKGLSSSIKAGIVHIETFDFDAVLIILADQPNVNTDYINQLIDEFKNHQNDIIASNYSGLFGVPAVFPKKLFSNLLKLHGDKGAKELLNNKLITIIPISSNSLNDIDTIEDYENLLKSTKS